MMICEICGKEIVDEKPTIYDGDSCHYQCVMDDIDSIGMDDEFGAKG